MRLTYLLELEFYRTGISSRDLFGHLVAYPKSLRNGSTFKKNEEGVGIAIDNLSRIPDQSRTA